MLACNLTVYPIHAGLIDGMGEMVLQYLDPMMSKLKALMAGDRDIQRAATSCIAMVAKSSRDYFLPYFDEVLAFIMASLVFLASA